MAPVFSIAVTPCKKRKNITLITKKSGPSIRGIYIAIISVCLIISLNFIGFHGFKPFIEFQNGSNQQVLTYCLQLFYYFSESLLITLCIFLGQKFAEKKFQWSPFFPSGGIFLALTWRVTHLFLQGLSGGIFTIFFSIIAGVIYTACNQNFKWSYIFIALTFIL